MPFCLPSLILPFWGGLSHIVHHTTRLRIPRAKASLSWVYVVLYKSKVLHKVENVEQHLNVCAQVYPISLLHHTQKKKRIKNKYKKLVFFFFFLFIPKYNKCVCDLLCLQIEHAARGQLDSLRVERLYMYILDANGAVKIIRLNCVATVLQHRDRQVNVCVCVCRISFFFYLECLSSTSF